MINGKRKVCEVDGHEQRYNQQVPDAEAVSRRNSPRFHRVQWDNGCHHRARRVMFPFVETRKPCSVCMAWLSAGLGVFGMHTDPFADAVGIIARLDVVINQQVWITIVAYRATAG